MNFILSNSVKYTVEESSLANELQQLGLPKEHCDVVSKTYRDAQEKLKAKYSEQTLRRNHNPGLIFASAND